METEAEPLQFEDSSEILRGRGKLEERKTLLRRRMTSKKLFTQIELLKRIDVAETRTPTLETRAKMQEQELQVCEAFKRPKDARSEPEHRLINDFLSSTTSFKALQNEYDAKVGQQFVGYLQLVQLKQGEDIIPYRNQRHSYRPRHCQRLLLLHRQRPRQRHDPRPNAQRLSLRHRVRGV
jgi:hypothetical protein